MMQAPVAASQKCIALPNIINCSVQLKVRLASASIGLEGEGLASQSQVSAAMGTVKAVEYHWQKMPLGFFCGR